MSQFAQNDPYSYKLRRLVCMSLLVALVTSNSFAQLKIAKLKYGGGGDWYANKTALPNLIRFCNSELGTAIVEEEDIVEVGGAGIFNYAYIYMTGHGNVVFSTEEAGNLRNYLLGGGFLHVDDNYGMDKFVRLELKKVFQIHEHDGKPAQGFGLLYQGRLVVYYSYECDLGNGWEDQRIHNDPEEKRQQALRMGANLISYCFTNN